MGMLGPRWLELRSRGDEQQHSQFRRPLDRERQEIKRSRVDPMDVLEDDESGLPRRENHQPLKQNGNHFLPMLLRAWWWCAAQLASLHGEQIAEQSEVLAIGVYSRQQPLQLGEFLLRRIQTGEVSGALELIDDGKPGAFAVVRRAEVAKLAMRLQPQRLLKCRNQSRLADAGFA